MTAIGLLVAVPAVFAFNWLQSRNRRIGALLSSFSNDLLAYMNSNGAVKPAVQAAPAAKPAAKPAAPANPTLNKS
jgi:biopolymer transport protein ExbB